MKEIKWYMNRIKAMSGREIVWRAQQKTLQRKEKRTVYVLHLPVTEIPLKSVPERQQPTANRIVLNWENDNYTVFESLNIFGVFDYQIYKKKWNAGFQTENNWPENTFSYEISCSQREDIGDIRTNWELNRHYQFSALAKSFYVTGKKSYFNELKELFFDWNRHNLFLHGVEWTSVMELAIRVVSWIYTYCFLEKSNEKFGGTKEAVHLMEQLSHGILVMTEYIIHHYARFSSANNHLIVEMFAVAMSGFFYNNDRWLASAVSILTGELPKQNSSDGVNREMSLHYQSLVMEAYGLLMLQMRHNHMEIPGVWLTWLSRMSEFLCDCCGSHGETVVFGDNDEGKLLDLAGSPFDYYRYVLDLMGLVLLERYSKLENLHENLLWCITKDFCKQCREKNCYYSPELHFYREGGYTLLRSKDRQVLIGIDHAELGFGSLAAHGHADALSIQVFYKGKPVLIDSGMYNYHVPEDIRDKMRSTGAHNTVVFKNIEQAEAEGAFLWGERYGIHYADVKFSGNSAVIIAEIRYGKKKHRREIFFDFNKTIRVKDTINQEDINNAKQIWHLAAIEKSADVMISSSGILTDRKTGRYSEHYNQTEQGRRYSFGFQANSITTDIVIK